MQNNFSIKDTITIKCGKQIYATNNSIVSLPSLLEISGGYAKYICLGAGKRVGNKMGKFVCSKTAKRVQYNYDSANGTMFSTFEATFTDDELPSNEAITEVALSPDADGTRLANYGEIISLSKEEGEPLYVRIELYLSVTSNMLYFVGGRNYLAEILLGKMQLNRSLFTIGNGNDYHPAGNYPRNKIGITSAQTTVTANGGTYAFEADFTTPLYEYLLLYGGFPVLRGYGFNAFTNKTITGTINDQQAFVIANQHVFMHGTPSVNGTQMPNYYSHGYVCGLTRNAPQLINYKLMNASIYNDATMMYLAVAQPKEVTVNYLDNDKLIPKYKVARRGTLVQVCSNGSVVMAGDGIVIAHFQNNRVVKHYLDYKNVTKLGANYESGSYHIAMVSNGKFIRLRYYLSGTISVLEEYYDTANDFTINRRDAVYIDAWSLSQKIVSCRNLIGSNQSVENNLKKYFFEIKNTMKVMDAVGDYIILYDTATTLAYYGNSRKALVQTTRSVVARRKLCQRGVLVLNSNNDIVSVENFYGNATTPSTFQLDVAIDYNANKTVACVGRYFLCMDDTTIGTFHFVECGKVIYLPNSNKGDSVSCLTRLYSDTTQGGAGAKVKIQFTVS